MPARAVDSRSFFSSSFSSSPPSFYSSPTLLTFNASALDFFFASCASIFSTSSSCSSTSFFVSSNSSSSGGGSRVLLPVLGSIVKHFYSFKVVASNKIPNPRKRITTMMLVAIFGSISARIVPSVVESVCINTIHADAKKNNLTS